MVGLVPLLGEKEWTLDAHGKYTRRGRCQKSGCGKNSGGGSSAYGPATVTEYLSDSAVTADRCPVESKIRSRLNTLMSKSAPLWSYRFGLRPETAPRKYGVELLDPKAMPNPDEICNAKGPTDEMG